MNEFFDTHYIHTNDKSHIIQGWSNGPQPNLPTYEAITLTTEGGYQFRLVPGGEENPQLFTDDGIPLYRWDGKQAIKRSEAEIQSDRDALPKPEPIIPVETRLKYVEDAIKIIADTLPQQVKAKITIGGDSFGC